MAKRVFLFALVWGSLSVSPTPSSAQSLLQELSTLLVEQRTSGPYVPDVAAAEATRDTVGGVFAVELGSLPLASSSGGFVYRLRRDLGVFERASDAFGPFFTERTLRNGNDQMTFGISFQSATFGALQGGDLRDGTFPTNAARVTGAFDPFSVDTLRLEFETRVAAPYVSYGITDRLAAGVTVPIVWVSFDGIRLRSLDGDLSLQSIQSGSANGLGDIVLNSRYLLAGTGERGLTVGGDLRLPTGRQEDLLGTGEAAAKMIAAGSWEESRLGFHVNGSMTFGGVSREVGWSTATTFALDPRLTVVGEVMGRYLSNLSRLSDVYQPHPVLAGIETMRWLPTERGLQSLSMLAGAKWNVARSWLLNTSMLIRLTDAGLRPRLTPSLSFEYAFGY
jgi:hypothetical protein